MSADKRSVATDALATLGTIIGPGEKRDAIHLAVEPVVAGHYLEPGDHVSVKDGVAEKSGPGNCLGIVDPFLPRAVLKGERFWFVMYPRQVHNLRHVWTHPAFPDEAVSVGSSPTIASSGQLTQHNARERIAAIASGLGDGMDYGRLLAAANAWLDSGQHEVQHDSQSWQDGFYNLAGEFWTLYQVVTGRSVPADKRESFFSCSC